MNAHSLTFHLTLALAVLSGLAVLPRAQAATPRSDIARPTDFLPQTADAGAVSCKSSQLKTCGRQAASRLKMPAGSAPKASYRFAEEEFLFDSGVGIFLQTAVAAGNGANAPMEWRRRLAFRRTADGRFQLVQVGIQYRCAGGSWQKSVCQRALAVAPPKPADRASGTAAGQAAGTRAATHGKPAYGVAASSGAAARAATTGQGTAGGADAVRAVAAGVAGAAASQAPGSAGPGTAAAGTAAPGMPDPGAGASGSTAPPAPAGNEGSVPRAQAGAPGTTERAVRDPDDAGAEGTRLDARWRPMRNDIRSEAFSPEDQARARAAAALERRDASAGAGSAAQGQDLPAGNGAGNPPDMKGAAGADEPAAGNSRRADIVAAAPSLSQEQLNALRAGARTGAGADAAAGDDPGAGGADGAGQPAGAGTAEAGAGGMPPDLAALTPARPDPVRGDMRLQPTAPNSVRNARGFSPLVPGNEMVARMSRLCEQPIDMCGKTVFDELFKSETFDELHASQVQRERFIYADGPVVSAVYLVTTVNLPDAVLAAERTRIEFVRRGSGWVAVAAGRQVRCRRGGQGVGDWTDAHCA